MPSRYQIVVLCLVLLCLYGFAISLDPFLHAWDERYHALVAKSLAADLRRPLLYTEALLPYSISDWTANHVWLHKPPLFLWQIAASLKIFGAEPWAVRLPSALLTVVTAGLTYDIALRWTHKVNVALLSAALFGMSEFPDRTPHGPRGHGP